MQERSSVKIKFRSSFSPKASGQPEARLWPLACLSICDFSRYKMAPWTRNNLPVWIEHQAPKESISSIFQSVHRLWRTKKQHRTTVSISYTRRDVSPAENIRLLCKRFCLAKTDPALRSFLFFLFVLDSNNFWLKHSEDERSTVNAVWQTSWVGMEEGAEECACQVDPGGGLGRWWREDDDLSYAQKLSFVTGRSLLESEFWLLIRLRFRFILDKSLSKTSPDRSADTRSSNSPPSSSPFAFAFRAFRSLSRCSFS